MSEDLPSTPSHLLLSPLVGLPHPSSLGMLECPCFKVSPGGLLSCQALSSAEALITNSTQASALKSRLTIYSQGLISDTYLKSKQPSQIQRVENYFPSKNLPPLCCLLRHKILELHLVFLLSAVSLINQKILQTPLVDSCWISGYSLTTFTLTISPGLLGWSPSQPICIHFCSLHSILKPLE